MPGFWRVVSRLAFRSAAVFLVMPSLIGCVDPTPPREAAASVAAAAALAPQTLNIKVVLPFLGTPGSMVDGTVGIDDCGPRSAASNCGDMASSARRPKTVLPRTPLDNGARVGIPSGSAGGAYSGFGIRPQACSGSWDCSSVGNVIEARKVLVASAELFRRFAYGRAHRAYPYPGTVTITLTVPQADLSHIPSCASGTCQDFTIPLLMCNAGETLEQCETHHAGAMAVQHQMNEYSDAETDIAVVGSVSSITW